MSLLDIGCKILGFSSETISNTEMAVLELNAEYFGVLTLQMMENAGNYVAREISSRFIPKEAQVVIFAGVGGNGGDGLVAARQV